jgi:hypothetical protein
VALNCVLILMKARSPRDRHGPVLETAIEV